MSDTTTKPGALALAFIESLHPTTARTFVSSDRGLLATASAVPAAERDLRALQQAYRDACAERNEAKAEARKYAALYLDGNTMIHDLRADVARLREALASIVSASGCIHADTHGGPGRTFEFFSVDGLHEARAALAATSGKADEAVS